MGVFPDFVMQFLINLCGRDKYSGVTAILIDITKEYSWGKLEGRSIYASRTFSNFCSPRTRRANSSLCVEISWNTRRRNFVSDSTRSGSCANDKPATIFPFFPSPPPCNFDNSRAWGACLVARASMHGEGHGRTDITEVLITDNRCALVSRM